VIDDHAHPFPLEFAPFEPESISLDAGADGDASERRRRLGPGRLFQELLTTDLGSLLGLPEEVGPDEVAATRDASAAADWRAWVRRLFDDAGITGMLLDDGVASAHGGPVDAYSDLTGRPIWRLARIDPLVDDLIGAGAGTAEIIGAVGKFMEEAAASGAVGFKTIVAYRTGLAVDPSVKIDEAEAALGDRRTGAVRRMAKPVRDLVIKTVLERAADLERPVQFHTGFGDSDIRLAGSNPLLLEDLLHSPAGSKATIVLIHGSYPWHEEVAYLATVRPNVYAEISLSNLFAPLGTGERLARLLELAPREKVLAGSDGHHLPETHWFGCRALAGGFDEVASRLRAAGARASFVESTRQALFEENARALYHLA
jgi:predicted TIM-barrel fold metal-dependent hydrolase